ncbi:MAG: PKD domain-containing protein, partial [Solirubrobacteraceae bacterium]
MSNAHRTGRSMLLALIVLLLWIPNSAQAATYVSWSADVQKPRVGQTVTFFASGDGSTYAWNFGDGGTATGDTAPHAFASPGTYTVKVTADGEVAYEQTITVRGNWAPGFVSMYPQTDDDRFPRVGQPASFVIQGFDPEESVSPMTYTVKWGDGTTNTYTDQANSNVPLVHTYATPGTYTVHYSATDQDGSATYPAQTTWGTPFRVRASNNPPPRNVSYFTDLGSAAVGDTVTFTATGSDPDGGSIASYAWDFGDGTPLQTSASDTRTHAFAQPGTYAVRLTETDGGGASTSYEYIFTVTPPGSNASGAIYGFGDLYYGSFARTGESLDFGAYAYNLPAGVTTTNYLFKWGDGTANTSTVNQFASHTYTVAGDYRVQVDISLSNGQTLHVQHEEYFYPDTDLYGYSGYTGSPLRVRGNHPPAYAYAYLTNNSGCLHAGQPISFGLYGADQDSGSITAFDVDWNSDGTYDQLNIPATDSAATVNHTYAAAGTYLVTVRAKDDDGASFEDLRNVSQVEVTPDNCLPYASSSARPEQPQTGKPITFDGSYSFDLDGSVATYQWDWDQNGTYDSTGVSPTHTYATDGWHNYTLKVTDNQGGVGYQQSSVFTHTGNHDPFFYSLYISHLQADTTDTIFFNASG